MLAYLSIVILSPRMSHVDESQVLRLDVSPKVSLVLLSCKPQTKSYQVIIESCLIESCLSSLIELS